MKKGFTLVELLAVIVILAVILVIAVPQINNVIKETRKNSLGSTAKLIAAKAEEKEVENDALEKTETITCADLVKLDDNYGNCTVSKNSTTNKWEVTIVGSGKFTGYTCTGTKDNMSCTERDTNTPEYVYSFLEPYYEYTYTVKNEPKCNTDLPGILRNAGAPEEWITSYVSNICSNSSDIDGHGSTSDFFASIIQSGRLAYEDISSFVERSNPVLVGAVEDYAQLNKEVFIRWPGNTVNFDGNDEKEVCALYEESLICLNPNSFNENIDKINRLAALYYPEDECSGDNDNEYYGCHNTDTEVVANDIYASLDGEVYISIGRSNCEIYESGEYGCYSAGE